MGGLFKPVLMLGYYVQLKYITHYSPIHRKSVLWQDITLYSLLAVTERGIVLLFICWHECQHLILYTCTHLFND